MLNSKGGKRLTDWPDRETEWGRMYSTACLGDKTCGRRCTDKQREGRGNVVELMNGGNERKVEEAEVVDQVVLGISKDEVRTATV